MAQQLPITRTLNDVLGGPVTAVLNALGIEPADAAAPLSNPIAMQIVVLAVLVIIFLITRARLSVESPGALQHVIEGVREFIGDLAHEMIGHGYERFIPFLMALLSYILVCNLIGLVPGFESPTASPVVPLGCAIFTWVYYQYYGFRENGAAYLKHFIGPVWWLGWLVFPIEIFSHLARMLSLTVRLYANMFAGDMVTLVFFSLIPIGVPVIFLGLHIGVSFIQTYIFVLLAAVYLGGATAHEH
ncbi:MAG: F0F1 ATP synthase subunit A [Candidatus Korobacteraceae bacterium]